LTTSGNNVSDLTGVDIGIGVQDEDISYVGGMNVLKTEIKKETTVSLTRMKSNMFECRQRLHLLVIF
jgi:hypothetical protein